MGVKSSHFSRFLSNFFYSSASDANLHFNTLKFVNFLSSPIRIASALDFSDRTFSARTQFSQPARIEKCQFIHCQAQAGDGGAIVTSAACYIVNSLFDECQGHHGGAISSEGGIDVQYVTFRSCVAAQGGAFDVRTTVTDDQPIILTVFCKTTGDYFGAFYSMAPSTREIVSSNFSQVSARQCVGTTEAKFGSFKMSFSMIVESSAASHNGGFCVRELEELKMTHTLILNCRHQSSEEMAAAVLIIYENPYESSIIGCSFVSTGRDRTKTITVASGHGLLITGCCFTGEQEEEVSEVHIVIEKCSFGADACESMKLQFSRAGYNPELKLKAGAKRIQPLGPAGGLGRSGPSSVVQKVLVFGAAAIIAVMFAALFVVIQILLKGGNYSSGKIPRAVL
jgi:hypothetical protein